MKSFDKSFDTNLTCCGTPKVRLLRIFNDFIKLPDARTHDAIRRLRRFRSPLPNPAAAWLSARARPSRALNGFGFDDTTTRHKTYSLEPVGLAEAVALQPMTAARLSDAAGESTLDDPECRCFHCANLL